MTTDTNNNKNWIDWLESRESAKLINQSQLGRLFDTFNASVSKEKSIEAIVKHTETAYMFKANFGDKRVNTFHHLTAVGGTMYDQGNTEYGFIQGLGEASAVAMTPDIE
eukprot:2874735-Ditylum_brightwellii.AAC.1